MTRNARNWSLVALVIVLLSGVLLGVRTFLLHRMTVEHCFGYFGHITANNNSVAYIQSEINSQEFKNLLAGLANKRHNAFRNLQVVVTNHTSSFFGVKFPITLNKTVQDAITKYVEIRVDGHSAKYAFDSVRATFVTDKELTADHQAIRHKFPEIPLPWLRSYFSTNFSGTNYTSYVVVDGTVAWEYQVMRPPEGEPDAYGLGRTDAMEYDPKYEELIREVNKLIAEQLKLEGIEGLGTCHTFWERKKKMLLEKGLEWKSPSELNPSTIFD